MLSKNSKSPQWLRLLKGDNIILRTPLSNQQEEWSMQVVDKAVAQIWDLINSDRELFLKLRVMWSQLTGKVGQQKEGKRGNIRTPNTSRRAQNK